MTDSDIATMKCDYCDNPATLQTKWYNCDQICDSYLYCDKCWEHHLSKLVIKDEIYTYIPIEGEPEIIYQEKQ
jgi:hypothetical protein